MNVSNARLSRIFERGAVCARTFIREVQQNPRELVRLVGAHLSLPEELRASDCSLVDNIGKGPLTWRHPHFPEIRINLEPASEEKTYPREPREEYLDDDGEQIYFDPGDILSAIRTVDLTPIEAEIRMALKLFMAGKAFALKFPIHEPWDEHGGVGGNDRNRLWPKAKTAGTYRYVSTYPINPASLFFAPVGDEPHQLRLATHWIFTPKWAYSGGAVLTDFSMAIEGEERGRPIQDNVEIVTGEQLAAWFNP
ncbi:MAG: hypothetical protein WC645_02140 [Candidatus Margulisiibacteriota bacterium]